MAAIMVTILMWVATFGLAALGLFYLYVKNIYKYFEQRGMPYVKPTFPFGIITSAVLNHKSLAFTFADLYSSNKGHKLVGMFSFWKKKILVRDVETIKNVMVKDFDVFQDRGTYYNKEKDPLTAHLFTLDGEAWKSLRAKLSPTFTSGKIKGMHDNIVECAKLLEKLVEKSNPTRSSLEFQSIFTKYGLEVISTTAFGIDCQSLTDAESTFMKMARRVVEPTLIRFFGLLLMINGQVGKTLNIRLLPKEVSDFFLGIFKAAVKFREANGIMRNDYLQLLMDLKDSKDEGSLNLTENDLAAQAFVFIVAGSETTAATMSFCLYELSRHPEIQNRLHLELDSLPDLSYDSVNGCQYLDMVVSETLRKYPPLGFLERECSQDYMVPGTGVMIEKGTQVLISLKGIQNDPEFFPDPDVFNPERFSKDNKDNIRPYTYMPFGEGPRYCIGKRFALMVVKTGLATLLRRYQVHRPQAASTATLKIEPRTFITFVSGGMWLQLKERT